MPDQSTDGSYLAFERDMRTREVALAERRLEHDMNAGNPAGRWSSPVFVAIMAAAIAAGGNAWVSYIEGQQSRAQQQDQAAQALELERERAEFARILTMLETGDAEQAARNLQFLIEVGLVSNPALTAKLDTYLKDLEPGEGPALASVQQNVQRVAELPSRYRARMLENGLQETGKCPEHPAFNDGIVGPIEMDCLGRLAQISPENTAALWRDHPGVVLQWVELGAPDGWLQNQDFVPPPGSGVNDILPDGLPPEEPIPRTTIRE